MRLAHYDIKPANVLVGWDQCIKLTDFDLARKVDEPIAPSHVGTLRFLPPEVFRSDPNRSDATAEKADIWMVGLVYGWMLWGRHPVLPAKLSRLETETTLQRFEGLTHYIAPVSALSHWVLQQCLHPDPLQRPTAAQLLDGIQHPAAKEAVSPGTSNTRA